MSLAVTGFAKLPHKATCAVGSVPLLNFLTLARAADFSNFLMTRRGGLLNDAGAVRWRERWVGVRHWKNSTCVLLPRWLRDDSRCSMCPGLAVRGAALPCARTRRLHLNGPRAIQDHLKRRRSKVSLSSSSRPSKNDANSWCVLPLVPNPSREVHKQ